MQNAHACLQQVYIRIVLDSFLQSSTHSYFTLSWHPIAALYPPVHCAPIHTTALSQIILLKVCERQPGGVARGQRAGGTFKEMDALVIVTNAGAGRFS